MGHMIWVAIELGLGKVWARFGQSQYENTTVTVFFSKKK